MRLGIVGSEEKKFTYETKKKALEAIQGLIVKYEPELIVSGRCHLGGIDIWAEEKAYENKIPFLGHPPAKHHWSGGYKERNLLIVRDSDLLVCITVKELPSTYTGMTFSVCYHCSTREPTHIKSGGCWTMWQARKQGKEGLLIII